MPIAQFAALINALPHIEAVLKTKGETIPRPDYSIADHSGSDSDKHLAKNEGEDAASVKAGRKNFEETSEED
jgi:hypothetical protein